MGKSSSLLVAMVMMILAIAMGFGFFLTSIDYSTLALGVIGVLVFIFSFLNRMWALYFIVIAMIFSPEIEVADTFTRAVTVRAEDLLIIIIMGGWFANLATDKNRRLFRGSPLNAPMLVYSFVLMLATLLGMMGGYVRFTTGFFYTAKMLEYFMFFFLVLNTPMSSKEAVRLLYVHLLVSLLLGIFGMSQVGEVTRVTSPFEGKNAEPSTMGGYIVISLSITLAYMIHYSDLIRKLAFGIASTLLAIPLLYTLSRASFIAFTFSYLTLTALSLRRPMTLFLLLVVMVASPFVVPGEVVERVMYTFQGDTAYGGLQVGNVTLEESTALRIRSYFRVLQWLKESPLFGYGVTGVGFIDGMYFRVLGETGVLGFLSFFWLQFSVMKLALRVRHRATNEFTRIFATGFFAGHIGLMFHGLGTSTHLIVRIMEPFWFLTALLIQLLELEGRSAGPVDEPVETPDGIIIEKETPPKLSWRSQGQPNF